MGVPFRRALVLALAVLVLPSLAPLPAGATDPDTTPPLLTIATPRPSNWYSAPLIAHIEATDADSPGPVAWVRLTDPAHGTRTDTYPPFRFPIDTHLLPDGPHNLTATAADAAGNLATVNGTLRIDRTAPNIQITSPSHGDLVLLHTVIETNATDATSGITAVLFHLDGNYLGTATAPPYQLEWMPLLQPGLHELTATAYDRATNRASHSIQILVL